MVNELAQWAVLVFLFVFVLGLTRQLGKFLTPREEARADAWGPAIGARLPDHLLSPTDLKRAQTMLEESGARALGIVVLSEACDACDAWLPYLADGDTGREVPVIALVTANSDVDYVAQVSGAAEYVIHDDKDTERLRRADLLATPMVLLLDDELVVRRKQVGGDPRSILDSADRSVDPDPITIITAGGS